VSNGGGNLLPQPRPKRDWARHAVRVTEIMNNQVTSLHERLLIASFTKGERAGTYWGIRTDISRYGLPDSLPCPLASTRRLAETATRLKRLDDVTQERLINWGYAVCDAAMRRHVGVPLSHVPEFPYPASGVG
jgi:NTE family protein